MLNGRRKTGASDKNKYGEKESREREREGNLHFKIYIKFHTKDILKNKKKPRMERNREENEAK